MTDTRNLVDSSTLPTIDDLSAPTILVDAFSGVISTNGVVVFGGIQSMLQVRSDADMTPVKKVVMRLAIPIGSLPSVAEMFTSQVQKMLKDGSIAQVNDADSKD